MWSQRRREQVQKVAFAVERARQRKEEEEKRYDESKQAAAKKLQDLEEKLKQAKQKDEESITVSEPKGLISVPPVPIPVPDWEREKENRERGENRDRGDRGGDRERDRGGDRERDRERSRTSSEGKDEKSITISTRDNRQNREIVRDGRDVRDVRDSRDSRDVRDERDVRDVRDIREPAADFAPVNQRSGGFMRQQSQQQDTTRMERDRERDREPRDVRDRDQTGFHRHYNIPPRFQKQKAERSVSTGNNRVSPNPERNNSQQPFIQQYSDQGGNNSGPGINRWSHNNHPNQGQQHIHTTRKNLLHFHLNFVKYFIPLTLAGRVDSFLAQNNFLPWLFQYLWPFPK